jgi:integrase
VQLTGDEVRRLYAVLLPLAEKDTLVGKSALACLMALLMALRSGDVTRRIVRDVDLDATVLHVSAGKSRASNRPRYVPEVLRPLLRRLVIGRQAFDPLFVSPWTESGHHTHRWLPQALEGFCNAAGVPVVCPHALKGTAGTLLAEMGTEGDRIAGYLSHEDRATTERHYVAEGAGEAVRAEKVLRVITGGLAG